NGWTRWCSAATGGRSPGPGPTRGCGRCCGTRWTASSPCPTRSSRCCGTARGCSSRSASTSPVPPETPGADVETQGAEPVAAGLGDLVRPPPGQPHPADAEVGDQAGERGGGVLLGDGGERARGAGQRHVDGGHAVPAEGDAVDKAQVDHVDAQLGVHDVAQRLQHVLGLRSLGCAVARLRGPARRHGLVNLYRFFAHLFASLAGAASRRLGSPIACAVASFHAIQASRAHLMRAGYLDTPANATASPSTSSSGSPSPWDCMSARNSSCSFIPSLTGRPITRSLSTDALAWLIEQPSAS